MEDFYKLFLESIREDYSKQDIKSISDYMEWLKTQYISIGDMGAFRESFPIIFDAQSKETVLDDVMFTLRNASVAGQISGMDDKTHEFDVRCVDLESEYGYQEAFSDELNEIAWQWIDDGDHELGICRIFSLEEYAGHLLLFFINYYLQLHPDFEKTLVEPKLENKTDIFYVEDGHVVFNNEEAMYYIQEHFIVEVLKNINDIVEGFVVLYCSWSISDTIDGDDRGYYVLSGYNPIKGCGEGWVIYSCAPA